MSIMLYMSLSTVLFVYARSMQRSASPLRRSWPMVDRRYVFTRRKPLKYLYAEQEVAGIVAKIENTR